MSDFLTDARTAGDAKRFQWLLDNGDIGTREQIDAAMEPEWTREGAVQRCWADIAEGGAQVRINALIDEVLEHELESKRWAHYSQTIDKNMALAKKRDAVQAKLDGLLAALEEYHGTESVVWQLAHPCNNQRQSKRVEAAIKAAKE